ncbi:MAG: hypothetical protein WAP74_02355 [Patescibacteria group bacterium]
MIWIFTLLFVIYIIYAFLQSKNKNQFRKNMGNHNELRKSYIQNLIEEEFQQSLSMELQTLSRFKKKLIEAEENNDKNIINEVKLQIKFFNNIIIGLKEIKKEIQKRDSSIWDHTNFSDEGINELRENISDSFSHAASGALRKIS